MPIPALFIRMFTSTEMGRRRLDQFSRLAFFADIGGHAQDFDAITHPQILSHFLEPVCATRRQGQPAPFRSQCLGNRSAYAPACAGDYGNPIP